MTATNPYDVLDTCECSAHSESECGCAGYVDLGQVRAWQQGYDAAADDLQRLRDRITALIQRGEADYGVNSSPAHRLRALLEQP